MIIALILFPLVVSALAFALFYAPGPPRYTLTRDRLTIHDRLYPVTLKAGEVEVGQVRVVDFADNPEWRPRRRTNGFSNLHYHTGWYRVAGGQKIRLYRADGKRLVLLPAKETGTAVLYEVPEPERFISELQRQWTGHSNEI